MESTHILYSPLLQNESKSIVRCDGSGRAGAYHEAQHNSSYSAIETAMYIYLNRVKLMAFFIYSGLFYTINLKKVWI